MSTAAVVERIRAARDARTTLRIRGAGTWMDAGRPVAAAETLSVAEERGIVEYVPGDLTLTARAGTPLRELEEATHANGQWLPLAPWGTSAATLGATISTATAGPYAAAFGLPRDAVLGMEFVTGTGDVVRSGGRVVKNVAGFDLTRLLTGSWGTLGVITEATVRLRALPQASQTLAVTLRDASRDALAATSATIRALPFAPFVCELVNAATARHLGLPARVALVVRIGGNTTAVAAQLDALGELGAVSQCPDEVIDALRTVDAGMPVCWRTSARPSAFADLWLAADADDTRLHGSPTRGVVRASAPHLRAIGGLPTGTARVTCERVPAGDWAAVPRRRADDLERAVKAKFDPDGILNPGILGGSE